MKSKKAFTLIELLVVIAIIGILATIAVISLSNARTKARDAKRVGNAKQIQTALELFYNDNGRYPSLSEFSSGSIQTTTSEGLVTYMMRVPSSPVPADGSCDNTTNPYIYTVSSDGSTYTMSYCIGGRTGGLSSGPKCLTRDGVIDASCGTSCTPSCSGVCSGDDGCGGTCPDNCSGGLACISGTCQAPCDGEQITVSSIAGYTCNEGAPYYDKCTYDAVLIGTQCWMKQNLNIGNIVAGSSNQSNTGSLEKYCYNNNYSYCQSEGAFYQWQEAMQYSSFIGAQGICPSGWHIPTDIEWHTLEAYLTDSPNTCNPDRNEDDGGSDCANAGDKLKIGGGSGFDAPLTGGRYVGGSYFWGRPNNASFWSSTFISTSAWYRGFVLGAITNAYDKYIYRDRTGWAQGWSIRCLRN